MTDIWTPTEFEIHEGDSYGGFNILRDGSLEINACDGPRENYRDGRMDSHEATLTIPPERAPEILAGIQAWIEQLPTP